MKDDNKKRLDWIDYLKGLAILTVVFLHSFNGYDTNNTTTGIILKYITSFHMALFFSISGYLYNKKIKNYKVQIIKKTKTLVLPYIVYGVFVGFILENVRVIIRGHEFDIFLTISKLLTLKISYLASWFLIVLFETYLLEYLINYISEKLKINEVYIAIIHLVLLIVAFLCTNIEFMDLYKIKLVFVSAAFFYFGKLLSRKNIKITNSIALIIIGLVLCFINKTCTYSNFEFGDCVLFTLSACCSITGWINLIKNVFIDYSNINNKKFRDFGQDSIIILLTHPIYLYFIRIVEKLANMEIHTFPPYAIFIILIIMEIITLKFMPKFIKKTFGK